MLVLLFVIWIIFWSHWSVLITRLGENTNRQTTKWILFGHSHCPKCKQRLKARNLIPILSFFLQKWKCEYCHEPISKFYLIIEIVSGLVFVFTYFLISHLSFNISNWVIVFWLIINRLLLLLIIYDIQKAELNVPIRFILILVALIPQFFNQIWNYQRAFFSSLIFWIIFYLIYYFAKLYVKLKYKKEAEWFGEWDAWLAFAIWILTPFVIQYNWLNFNVQIVFQLLLIFIILSCLIWILRWFISKYLIPKFVIRNSKFLISSQIPFLPSMIITFRILLFFANNFINFIFPSLW